MITTRPRGDRQKDIKMMHYTNNDYSDFYEKRCMSFVRVLNTSEHFVCMGRVITVVVLIVEEHRRLWHYQPSGRATCCALRFEVGSIRIGNG